jgi:hypothetical protein
MLPLTPIRQFAGDWQRLQTPLLGIGILTALNWNAKIEDRRDFVMHCSHGSKSRSSTLVSMSVTAIYRPWSP